MNASTVFDNMIEEKLLNLHTVFIAKVISVNNPKMCSVQPLDKIKAYGQEAKSQAVITRVPVLNHVRHYTLVKQELKLSSAAADESGITPSKHPTEKNIGHIKVEPIKAGDLVLCVCTERDLSSAVKGASVVPPLGHHQIKDAVVVGLLGGWSHE